MSVIFCCCFCRLISAYNSLTDRHLAGYFSNSRIRRHLQRAGLVRQQVDGDGDDVILLRATDLRFTISILSILLLIEGFYLVIIFYIWQI